MSQRSTTTPAKQSANLTDDQKRKAIPLLERRLSDLSLLDVNSINDPEDPRIEALHNRIDTALSQIFDESRDYTRYKMAAGLYRTTAIVSEPTVWEQRKDFDEFKKKATTTLEEIVARFREELEMTPTPVSSSEQNPQLASELTRKVFIVHGREEAPRDAVARFLERVRFDPIILHEQANKGRTVIEKIEAHGDVAFAVILLTPDDEGALKGETPQPRPRQNVLLELGYFIGHLGRDRVCALKTGDMELPSDFGGVVWETFDGASGGWKQTLGRELEAAGFSIDWKALMRS